MAFNPLDPLGIMDKLFGHHEDPSKGANKYLDKIPGILDKYLGPYHQRGLDQYGGLKEQYGQLTGDPGGFINRVGQSYQKSPGFDFALKQALEAAAHGQAAGGMAGSPQHEYENMGIATGMANQDYMNWLKTALGQYGLGLKGEEDLYGIGAGAAGALAGGLSGNLGQQAGYKYGSNLASQQQQNALIEALLGGAIMAGGGGFI